MMIVASSIAVVVAPLLFVFLVRRKDLPPPEAALRAGHLHERKNAIYESLRDLQFDFRTGKLLEADYYSGKQSIQKELAAVLLQLENIPSVSNHRCLSCGSAFERTMKFCGACGKKMREAEAS